MTNDDSNRQVAIQQPAPIPLSTIREWATRRLKMCGPAGVTDQVALLEDAVRWTEGQHGGFAAEAAPAALQAQPSDDRIYAIADGLFDYQRLGNRMPAMDRDGFREIIGAAISEWATTRVATPQAASQPDSTVEGPIHTCGRLMVKNPHPDAGHPRALPAAGYVYECVSCLVKARHGWSQRALKAEGALREAAAPQPEKIEASLWDVDLARYVLVRTGYSISESREPDADRKVDMLAADLAGWIERHPVAPKAGEDAGPVARSIGYIDRKGTGGNPRAVLTTGWDEHGNGWEEGTKIYATSQPAPAVALLAADHKSMRVDYAGLLKQAQSALRHGAEEPGLAELLRQLQEHLTELGRRWYAGDTAVVDEILQFYCVEKDARAALIAQGTA